MMKAIPVLCYLCLFFFAACDKSSESKVNPSVQESLVLSQEEEERDKGFQEKYNPKPQKKFLEENDIPPPSGNVIHRICSMANGHAEIQWNFYDNTAFTLVIRFLEDDFTLSLEGLWSRHEDDILASFFYIQENKHSVEQNVRALFGGDKFREFNSNPQIIENDDTQGRISVSINMNENEIPLWIYRVRCNFV